MTPDDPSRLLPLFPIYLSELLAEQPSPLPSNLKKTVENLDMQSVSRTANALSGLISRVNILSDLPYPPISCAIFILSLEGEALTSLPNYSELASCLAQRFGVSKDVVMRRYKVIYGLIEGWLLDVPWLQVPHGPRRKGGAKMAKRVAVARGLKDVLQFQEEIWTKKLEGMSGPNLDACSDDDEPNNHSHTLKRKDNTAQSSTSSKRRKTAPRRPLDAVYRFLLSPEEVPSSDLTSTVNGVPFLDAVSQVLTGKTTKATLPVTRLQALVNRKGEANIADDELFDEGELEGLLRTEEERAALLSLFDWADINEPDQDTPPTIPARCSDRTNDGSSRINMEAFNRLLAEDEHLDEAGPYIGEDISTEALSGDPPMIEGCKEMNETLCQSSSP